MLNMNLSFKTEKKHPFFLFFFTFSVLILSACPYFFLEFQEKSLRYQPVVDPEENISFSSEHELVRSFLFPKLKDLKIYQIKARPDFTGPFMYFFMLDQRLYRLNFSKTFYLKEEKGTYLVYNEPSELSVRFQKKGQQVLVDQTFSDESLLLHRQDKLSVDLYQDPKLLSTSIFDPIQKGKFLGKDLVSSFLGENLSRFQIGDQIFLVRQGDLLFFDKNKWVLSDTIDDVSNKPILKISHIDQSLEIDCFDETGMRWAQKKYALIFSTPEKTSFSKNIEEVMMRSDTKMSLFIEKQKLFLEEKSWAMKREGKWSVVKSSQVSNNQMDALLYVEKIDQGQMTAHLINPKKNQSEKLSIKLLKGSFSKENRRQSKKQRGVQ